MMYCQRFIQTPFRGKFRPPLKLQISLQKLGVAIMQEPFISYYEIGNWWSIVKGYYLPLFRQYIIKIHRKERTQPNSQYIGAVY